MSNLVVLIIAAGPNLGQTIAEKFSNGGYKVALAARSLSDGFAPNGYLHIEIDLSNPESVRPMFKVVEDQLGPPNVVVFNGATRLTTPPNDPFSASLNTLETARKVGFESAYIAAQMSLQSFAKLPTSVPKTFIYTGNTLNQIGIAGVFPFALGKVSAAMMVEYGANAYGGSGYRFYYADQRQPDGRPSAKQENSLVDGEAHADMYWELATAGKQEKWLVTFVKGKGRVDFKGIDFDGNTRFND